MFITEGGTQRIRNVFIIKPFFLMEKVLQGELGKLLNLFQTLVSLFFLSFFLSFLLLLLLFIS